MNDNLLKYQSFKLKGRLFTLTVLQLLNTDMRYFEQQLEQAISQAPKLFDNTPLILDCTALEAEVENLSLEPFLQAMRMRRLFPVAIQANNPILHVLAQAHGIAVLHGSSTHDKLLIDSPLEISRTQQPAVESCATKILSTPVRSGQQVVAKGGDLIIAAAVSHGAELLADGNIHIYGPLRGRALAGMSGDKNARIFCHALEAELISIAGYYRLRDAIEPRNEPCQIYLQNDHICIESI